MLPVPTTIKTRFVGTEFLNSMGTNSGWVIAWATGRHWLVPPLKLYRFGPGIRLTPLDLLVDTQAASSVGYAQRKAKLGNNQNSGVFREPSQSLRIRHDSIASSGPN
jgi:hypothetical protein